jgi:16S rRNA (guanine966-N2)-methyltransferase
MTRIVSGTWGGRRLAVPADRRVRPTAERVREAWLNVLGPLLPGARVVDLCAGTGALGLEALSRGASRATFVDSHADSLRVLRSNIASLDAGDRCDVRRADVIRFTAELAPGMFDIALADPPFTTDLAAAIVAAWQAVPFAALLAVEHSRTTTLHGGETRRWGDIAVTFFRAA